LRQPPAAPLAQGTDLDSTDQLPALDPAAYEAAARERLNETWVQPAPGLASLASAGEPAAGGEDPLQTAAANLREAQELLASRGARLAEIERSLEETHGARAAAERRLEQLGGELAEARSAVAQRVTQIAADQAEARAAAEQRDSQHAAEIGRVRAAAEQREAQLTEELGRARAAAGQRASELIAQLEQVRRAAEQREAQQARQLGEEKSAAEQRINEERAAAVQAQRARDLESQQALSARDHAHGALRQELQEARALSAGYFELLQSAERRRSVLEGLVSDLQDEAEVQAVSRAKLARELAGRDTRAGELESDLGQRAARIAALESQVGSLTGAVEQRDDDVTRLHATQANLNTALEGARAATATVSARAAEHEAALTGARTRIATLEAELAAERKRALEREQELTRVRGEMEDWAGALRTAQLERSGHLAGIAAGEARVKQLEERVAEQADTLHALQSASDAAIARSHELEADLHAAEDGIARLEAQLRGRSVRVSELEKANQQWRHTLEETRAAPAGSDGHRAPREDARADSGEGAAVGILADGATRLLIRGDGEREVVHVLARKTSNGRTPDNDLQIDAKYISRHHAVILAGPVHTIIEDLNSTNGVTVNGRRISRQLLQDGDTVVVGRTQYRFAVRRIGEKR
jgi:chromosome segregation ATPase